MALWCEGRFPQLVRSERGLIRPRTLPRRDAAGRRTLLEPLPLRDEVIQVGDGDSVESRPHVEQICFSVQNLEDVYQRAMGQLADDGDEGPEIADRIERVGE